MIEISRKAIKQYLKDNGSSIRKLSAIVGTNYPQFTKKFYGKKRKNFVHFNETEICKLYELIGPDIFFDTSVAKNNTGKKKYE